MTGSMGLSFKEWQMITKGLKSVYTSERFLPDADAIRVWYAFLQDMDYSVVNAAVQKYILTNKFPPTVSEIREFAAEIVNGKNPEWGEAWAEACKAISRYGIFNPKKALKSLRPLTRETVEQLGYKALCMSENQAVDRANFRACYEIVSKRSQQTRTLPLPLQNTIKQLSEGKAKEET